MLSLKISDKNIDLPDDFSFTMNLKSPIFGEVGSYSYPFRIPGTPKNSIIFNFPHRVENTGHPFKDYQGRFEWNGVTLFCGTARLKTVSNKSFEGSIFDGTGGFYYQLKNRMLQHVDMGKMDFASEAEAIEYFNDTLYNYYPTVPFACPRVHNENYFDPPTTDDELKDFNYNYGNELKLQTVATSQRTLLVPMLYLRYVLSKLAEGLGYVLDDQMFTSNADFSRLVLFNATCCNNGGTNSPPREPTDYSLQHLIFNYHIPRLLINDFLKALENYFGLAIFADNTTKSMRIIPLNDIVTSSECIDYSKNVISISSEMEESNSGYAMSMQLDSNDDTFASLTGLEEMLLKKNCGSVAAIADLPVWPVGEIGSVYWVESMNNYYMMDAGKTWGVTSIMALLKTKFLFRDGSQSIESKFSPIWYDDGNTWAVVTNQMATYRDITPRLMFVEQYDGPGVHGMTGKNFTSNYSLFYPWETGLFNKLWKEYLSFRSATKLVKIQRQMSFSEIRDFDFSRKIMIYGVKYLVKNVQVTLKKDRIMPALLECYTCQ